MMRASILLFASIAVFASAARAEPAPTAETKPASVVATRQASGAGAEPAAPLAEYAGVWQLDRDASDPVGPMLERMEAPWIARRIADSMAPEMTLTPLPGGNVHVRNENPIQTTEQTLSPDGVERASEDPMGRRVLRSAEFDAAGRLVVTSRTYVDADRAATVESTWTRPDETLVIVNRLDPDGDTIVIRRVFRREGPPSETPTTGSRP